MSHNRYWANDTWLPNLPQAWCSVFTRVSDGRPASSCHSST